MSMVNLLVRDFLAFILGSNLPSEISVNGYISYKRYFTKPLEGDDMFGSIIGSLLGFLIAIFIFGILIFIHEFGHFLLAKLSGIGVEIFSIGFGSEICGFTIGNTRYRISLIPFGGYCKLKGENEEKDKDEPDAMYNRPAYARLLTVIAGPLFNFLFAFVIMFALFSFGFKEQIIAPYIEVYETLYDGSYSPAYIAGLRSGDYILSIDDKHISSYPDIPKNIVLSKSDKIKITFLRDGKTNEVYVNPKFNQNRGVSEIGISMLFLSKVGGVISNSPADKIGLKENDRIVSINGENIEFFYQLREKIKDKANQAVTIVYERNSKFFTNQVILDKFEGKGFLGVSPKDVITYQKIQKATNLMDCTIKSFKEIGVIIEDTLNGIIAMIKGKINVRKNIAGPIRIIGITSEIAMTTDFITILRFMVLLSVALAFFNLLPIPGLDGGHVILNLIETVTPFKIPKKIRYYIEYIGFLIIIFISIAVFLNDILNILGRR